MSRINRPKRILIFSLTYYPEFVGGAEVAIREITDRIPPEEIEFEMITLRLDSRLPRFEKIGNVVIHRLGFSKSQPTARELVRFPLYLNKVFYPLLSVFKAIKLNRNKPFDGLWPMMSYAGFSAVLFRFFYKKLPYVLTLQEGDDLDKVGNRFFVKLLRPLWRRVFREPAVIQGISNHLADWARRMGSRCPVEVIPNGVDLLKFRPAESKLEIKEAREGLGWGSADKVVISTSRLASKNGLADLIKSMINLPADVKLLIVGDGPLLGDLELMVENLQLNDRVRFTGFVSPEKLPELLGAADVFARPSLSEGMGNSFIEAMAVGLPVVGTAVGGITDFLRDKETGLVCAVGDPADIARKISILLRDNEIRQYVAKNARAMVESRYSWPKLVSGMKERVFKKILE